MAVKLNPEDYEFADQQPAEEGWGEYAKRNALKAPAQLYSTVRSGLGLGHLAKVALEEEERAPKNKLEEFFQAGRKKALRYVLPSPEEATQEAQALYSLFTSPENAKYLTESRSGDTGAELLLQELPLALATGGLSSIPAAAKYGTRLAGILGGSQLGSYAGGALGELLGRPKTGEALGAIAGGYGGGALASKASGSKHLVPAVLKEEASAAERAAQAAEQHARLAQEFEQKKAARIAAIEEEFKPKIAKAGQEHTKTRKELAADRDAFEKRKAQRVATIDKEIIDLERNIENLLEGRKPYYKQASLHNVKIEAPTSKINDVINETSLNLGGTSASEQALIYKALNDVEEVTKGGTAPIGQLERVEKNIGGQISRARKSGDANVVRHLTEVKEALKEAILEHGPEERIEPWLKGEEATWKASQLKKQKPMTKAELQAERSRIKAEKYPETEKVAGRELLEESKGNIKKLVQQKKDLIETIGKEKYESFVTNKETPPTIQKLVKEFEKGHKKGVFSKFAEGALGAALGFIVGGKATSFFGGAKDIGKAIKRAAGNVANAGKYEKAVFDYTREHHPALFKEYMDTLTSVKRQNIPRVVLRLNDISKKMEDAYSESGGSSGLNPDEYEFA